MTGLFHALVLVSLTPKLRDMKGFASRTPYNLRSILPSKTAKYPWIELKDFTVIIFRLWITNSTRQ
ncbi:hypothetical protein F5B18DRAFT_636834 [Nemania serpens]|nr:hypothetical protein F5B18DRAFT_636834 [Nemania serpens]